MRLIIKGLGDYTTDIVDKLKVGDQAKVEGPYGQFTNRHISKNKQVWIAGGIGITPFLSLSRDIKGQKVKLLWSVGNTDVKVVKSELESVDSKKSNFNFEIWVPEDKGYINADSLGVDNFNQYAYLICGPDGLKKSIIKQLKLKGVKNKDIYDEEFRFR